MTAHSGCHLAKPAQGREARTQVEGALRSDEEDDGPKQHT